MKRNAFQAKHAVWGVFGLMTVFVLVTRDRAARLGEPPARSGASSAAITRLVRRQWGVGNSRRTASRGPVRIQARGVTDMECSLTVKRFSSSGNPPRRRRGESTLARTRYPAPKACKG